ncbi:piggyBac transposable element-derived protein 4-like [Phymastichus coffea]|uniref:piggyBac transposable element-derived protein 4-like n=1 Tax=Phymastichus coffea TaxID=108790 RepID=UPI00273A7793|nr:piggyBac transposable element-derived protein 4-like [Phymastichus coffea]
MALGKETQTYHHYTDEEEIRAYIGILYYISAWKSNGMNTHDLWSNHNGINFYRCVMSRARFMLLSSCLRFDDKQTRNKDDRFSPIRAIWEIFIKNCTSCYQPSRNCTLDEILLGFRGRCKFRMYIKSKPDKYGLKIFALNDPTTSYLIYVLPYLGKIPLSDKLENEQLTEYYFRKCTVPIYNTHSAVTCDNWFTSVPLLQRMKEEPYGLKITDTVKKNKKEIPAEFKVSGKSVLSAKFCHANDLMLVSYTPKKNKIVLVISSDKCTDATNNGKPEVILDYNKTKGGTDCFDWLCHSHTVCAKTNRWPLRVFFGMLDIAAVNARILLKCKLVNNGVKKSISAKACLDKLVMHLVTPHLVRRSTEPTLRNSLRAGINTILNKDVQVLDEERVELPTRKRCGLCKRGTDRKTKSLCPSCERLMCDDHRAYIYTDCAGHE